MFPSTPKRHQLTRDERLRIQTLYEAGWKFDAIHAHLRSHIQSLSLRQIEYTCQFTHPTPQKRSGRPPLLTEEQKNELIAFLRTSKITRRLSYLQLALHFNWGVDAVKGCLERADYKRHIVRTKPPLSKASKRARIQ
jgi:transposase